MQAELPGEAMDFRLRNHWITFMSDFKFVGLLSCVIPVVILEIQF